MARPISTSDPYRGGYNGNYHPRYTLDDSPGGIGGAAQLDQLQTENAQLRSLCAELEQALQEATQNAADGAVYEERIREYEQILEEKTETIRQLHQQLEETQAALQEAVQSPAASAPASPRGPLPREDELLTLSEELERERRQLQEDEQAVMEQMRQMEMSMARERADMARQRNDLQRLYGEIRHELERLERNGALQNKMEELKARLQDAASRRGAAPTAQAKPGSSPSLPAVDPNDNAEATPKSFFGRLFGNK